MNAVRVASWMIPLASVPEFSVGSQPLFDQIRAATVPLFGLSTTVAGCFPEDSGGGEPEGHSATAHGWSDGGEEAGAVEPDVLRAFDVVVLQDTELRLRPDDGGHGAGRRAGQRGGRLWVPRRGGRGAWLAFVVPMLGRRRRGR